MRSGATLDFFDSTGGARTVEEAVRVLAGSRDKVVVQDRTRSGVSAYLLRPEGTPYSGLDVVELDDRTWRVGGMESCAGEEPLARR